MNCKNKPELRERLAAEYALGTLRGRARDRMRRWMREDAALARAVAEWEARLAPLAQAVQPVRAPARVWDGIEARLGRRAAARPAGGTGRASGARSASWRAARWPPCSPWSCCCRRRSRAPAESMPAAYIAVLSDPKTQRPVLVATAARQDARLSVRALDPAILVAGRSLELWAVPRKGGPRSLGLVEAEQATLQLAAAADRSLGDVPLLAVSLEPRGGSPTGAPTGPVLYSGPCVKYW